MADEGEAELRAYADALAAGITAALPGWVVRSVDRVFRAWQGPPPEALLEAAGRAGREAAAAIGPRVTELLARDVDDQPTTPLALVREGTRFPTTVLRDAGVPPGARDEIERGMFPEDVYGLTPASFADVDPSLGALGVTWGAAKAWVHRRRHG